MKKVKCENGHYYDADRFALCPVCGQQNDGRHPWVMESESGQLDSEVTEELPKSMGIDELAPTAYLSPEETLALFEDGGALPQSASEPPEEEPLTEQEGSAAPLTGSGIDEIAPTVWIAPDEDLHLREDGPMTPAFTETAPEETPLEEISSDESPSLETESVGNKLLENELAESESYEAGAVETPSRESPPLPETPPQTGSLAQAIAASHSTSIPVLPQPVKSHGVNTVILPVGWIVGLNGANRGVLFPCKAGRNRIGSGRGMDIIPRGEPSISQETHALIIYEPKKRRFFIQAGNGDELTYLNDELVFTHEELKAYDRIALGKAEFVFVPLCGEYFSWDGDPHGR